MNLQKNIKLAPHTTYRIGGPADYFIQVTSRNELIEALKYALNAGIPWFLLGTGANILVSDAGFRGLVIKNDYADIDYRAWTATERCSLHWVTAGSGARMSELIDFAAERSLSGLEHFTMIPSTVGGALWQNLHFLSPDRSRTMYISEWFHHASTFNTITGQENFFFTEDFKFGYDTSILHLGNQVVLEATFQLNPGERSIIEAVRTANNAWRNEKHPPLGTEYSCGSVFKKVLLDNEWIAAARLIDQADLKGFMYGGAQISLKHPNFITHTGQGTATHVMHCIRHVQNVVFEKYGVHLEPEIRFVGEF